MALADGSSECPVMYQSRVWHVTAGMETAGTACWPSGQFSLQSPLLKNGSQARFEAYLWTNLLRSDWYIHSAYRLL